MKTKKKRQYMSRQKGQIIIAFAQQQRWLIKITLLLQQPDNTNFGNRFDTLFIYICKNFLKMNFKTNLLFVDETDHRSGVNR